MTPLGNDRTLITKISEDPFYHVSCAFYCLHVADVRTTGLHTRNGPQIVPALSIISLVELSLVVIPEAMNFRRLLQGKLEFSNAVQLL